MNIAKSGWKQRIKKSLKSSAGKAESKAAKERPDTKKAIVLEMLRRKEGATTAAIARATDWQNHTIRGFISGTVTSCLRKTLFSRRRESIE